MSKSVFKNWEGSDCWLLVWEAHASRFIGQVMEAYLKGLISHKHGSLIIFCLMPSSVITLRVITQLSPGCKTIQISQRKHPGISMVSLGCHNFMSVGYKQIIYVLIWFFPASQWVWPHKECWNHIFHTIASYYFLVMLSWKQLAFQNCNLPPEPTLPCSKLYL